MYLDIFHLHHVPRQSIRRALMSFLRVLSKEVRWLRKFRCGGNAAQIWYSD